tara:strand:+ start:123 stop:452 length:330 start_codon:yes stop_codon:yes gene_type:complete
MSWQNVLKNNSATELVKKLILDFKRVTAEHDVSSLTFMQERLGLPIDKEQVRASLEKTFLNPDIAKKWFRADRSLMGPLNEAGYTLEDVDWLEALTPTMALYDKILDGL